jgi:hypothetical protein
MIYLLITVAGVIFLFLGLWAMSYGFSTPPNIFLFLAGLFSFVIGLMVIILFAGKIELGSMKKSAPVATESPETRSRAVKRTETVKSTIKSDNKKIEPKKQIKPRKIIPKRAAKKDASTKPKEVKSTADVEKQSDKSKKPSRKPRNFLRSSKKDKTDSKKLKESNNKEAPSKTGKSSFNFRNPLKKSPKTSDNASKAELAKDNMDEQKTGSEYPKPIKPAQSKPVKPIKPQATKPMESESVKPVKSKPVEPVESKPIEPSKPKRVKPVKSVKPVKKVKTPNMLDKSDNHYVKERLNKLKQDYIENVDDVEDLIEERLDSFRGAINQIRSESKEPSIIWSFDASDVQEAMKDTILTANSKVIMMYPWIRNIDVGILKKFMDTKSRMIIQEAGLDDDASVELIKVLLDNNVQIRTMPHIHTVAVVSDDKHGLIISTDPIYESFEVGVIYKDEKSIMEIEKLFEEAWNLSQEISLENE